MNFLSQFYFLTPMDYMVHGGQKIELAIVHGSIVFGSDHGNDNFS